MRIESRKKTRLERNQKSKFPSDYQFAQQNTILAMVIFKSWPNSTSATETWAQNPHLFFVQKKIFCLGIFLGLVSWNSFDEKQNPHLFSWKNDLSTNPLACSDKKQSFSWNWLPWLWNSFVNVPHRLRKHKTLFCFSWKTSFLLGLTPLKSGSLFYR